ncbi:MAG: shikimate kinase [Kaistella sp.]|nr:shikimate kinase [Kaistella sp.]
MVIALLGYMGSGKSHIARLLSQKLNFEFIDLDKQIILKNNRSVAEIFKMSGEIYFRKQERELLEEYLASKNDVVLSLGGGTPAYYNNMEVINQNSFSFFLRGSVNTLSQRLLKQKNTRPLIAKINDEDLPEFIAKHLFERNAFYSKAQFTVDIDGKTPEEIAEEIIHHLPF